ncbi:uncharacterized protein Z519_06225 [Cladophialophora bantiana CBS 173.52]|uniref:Uncharacterized protein n=1 Tax=Cladophialophora bantiana (strain ATCC 10958 / CBS 173.52 / CDC B-1940 / NIH 8579) TaxID=1442370 RepID=A0A0D2HRZ5_CLAB1|nr:uncharacterized protein Z519_06225 [Cladophialophora bantiana CBS 173.52]KIW93620.1 hypothetical protein Z519_06225 [Cladophialophora bantiana CBS 173.52]
MDLQERLAADTKSAMPSAVLAQEVISVIREAIEQPGIEWTSVITAPCDSVHSTYEEWTCRASHIITWYPPPATRRAPPEDSATTVFSAGEPVETITGSLQPAFANVLKHPLHNHKMLSELQETFAA